MKLLPIRESVIEKNVCKYAESLGWYQLKMASPGTKGVPDRIFFREGETVLVEFKSSKGYLSASQLYIIRKLRAHKMIVLVVSSFDHGKVMFDAFEE